MHGSRHTGLYARRPTLYADKSKTQIKSIGNAGTSKVHGPRFTMHGLRHTGLYARRPTLYADKSRAKSKALETQGPARFTVHGSRCTVYGRRASTLYARCPTHYADKSRAKSKALETQRPRFTAERMDASLRTTAFRSDHCVKQAFPDTRYLLLTTQY